MGPSGLRLWASMKATDPQNMVTVQKRKVEKAGGVSPGPSSAGLFPYPRGGRSSQTPAGCPCCISIMQTLSLFAVCADLLTLPAMRFVTIDMDLKPPSTGPQIQAQAQGGALHPQLHWNLKMIQIWPLDLCCSGRTCLWGPAIPSANKYLIPNSPGCQWSEIDTALSDMFWDFGTCQPFLGV